MEGKLANRRQARRAVSCVQAEIHKVGVDFFIPLSVSQVPERCKSCWIKVGCARESLRPITPFLSSFVRIPNDSRNESQKR